MARNRGNILVRGLSGKIGDQVVFRDMKDGRTIVAAMPDFSSRKLSVEQKAHHARFKEAAAYARLAAKNQPVYAELAKGTSKTAYNVALGDWFNPPVIEKVEESGGVIRVWASDDVCVAGVRVKVFDSGNKVSERGEAVLSGDVWEYLPKSAGRVVVEARDLAQNVVSAEVG